MGENMKRKTKRVISGALALTMSMGMTVNVRGTEESRPATVTKKLYRGRKEFSHGTAVWNCRRHGKSTGKTDS